MPPIGRSEKRKKPNITQPEYFSGNNRMSPTKLIYNIKERVDNEIKESNGLKEKDGDESGGVTNSANYARFTDAYMVNPRTGRQILPEV